MISKDNKTKAIAKLARGAGDVGSPEVPASIFTERIKELTQHMKVHKHDFMARRGLVQLVGKRKRVLAYLKDTDFAAYKATVSKLGLRK